jgi:hypothetical protein
MSDRPTVSHHRPNLRCRRTSRRSLAGFLLPAIREARYSDPLWESPSQSNRPTCEVVTIPRSVALRPAGSSPQQPGSVRPAETESVASRARTSRGCQEHPPALPWNWKGTPMGQGGPGRLSALPFCVLPSLDLGQPVEASFDRTVAECIRRRPGNFHRRRRDCRSQAANHHRHLSWEVETR